jgi:hypothetical protein
VEIEVFGFEVFECVMEIAELRASGWGGHRSSGCFSEIGLGEKSL